MLVYKRDVLELLKEAGYTTTRLRREKLLGENAIQYIREKKPIGAKALDKVCELLNCQPGELLEYVPNSEQKKDAGSNPQECIRPQIHK